MNLKEFFKELNYVKLVFKGKMSIGECTFIFFQDMNYLVRLLRYKLIGVDIERGEHARSARNINSENRGYMETKPFIVKSVLKKFSITPADKIFDYGSGKGFALILFSKYPFSEIAGVELIKDLHDAALRNFSKLNLKHVTSYNEDATKFENIDQFNYFYLYNPFTKKIFEAVIGQIANSLSRNPRKITIIYNHSEEKELLINSGLFPFFESIPLLPLYKSKFIRRLAYKRYKNRSISIFSNEPLEMK